jgi:hypothetical protein
MAERNYKVELVHKDTVDGMAIEVVNDAFKVALEGLVEHYIDNKRDGPMKGGGVTEIFVSLVVTSIGNILLDISPDMAVFAAQELSTALIQFAREGQKHRKEHPEG